MRPSMPKRDGNDYEVGYGKPPAERRFKKGVSGNPRGRPRGSKNIGLLLEEELSNKILINENGKRTTITKRQGIVKQMVNRAVGGNDRAVRLILERTSEIEKNEARFRGHDGSERVSVGIIQAVMARVDAEKARRARELGGPPESDKVEPAAPQK
jgi:hypothetical protein